MSASRWIRYAITDRKLCGGLDPLAARAGALLQEGIEFLQIRERDLPVRELAALVRRITALPNPHVTRILVNDRVDVALACGAHGVHLRDGSIAPRILRPLVPGGFVISVSCHDAESVRRAAGEDADLALLAPVFAKENYALPLGLEAFGQIARATHLPVIALGGVTRENAAACREAGASGIAAIRLFFDPQSA